MKPKTDNDFDSLGEEEQSSGGRRSPINLIKWVKSRKKSDERPESEKPDKLFDIIVVKMMGALTLSVTFLFGGGTLFVYAASRNIPIGGHSNIVGSFLGIHLALLMLYYSVSFFKYIISD